MAFSSSPSFFRILSSGSESARSAGIGGPGPTAAASGGGWGGEGLAAAGGSAGDWSGAGGLAGGSVGPAAAAAGGDADLPRRHSKCHIHQAAQQQQQPVTIDTTATATNISSQSCSIKLLRNMGDIVGLNQKGVARIKSSFLYYDQQSQKFTEIY